MDTPRTMAPKTLAKAFDERKHYNIFETGGEATAGKDIRYYAVEHKHKPASKYTLILELDRSLMRFVPNGCSCPSERGNAHCKHAIMYMDVAGLIADDLLTKYDPNYIALRVKAKV